MTIETLGEAWNLSWQIHMRPLGDDAADRVGRAAGRKRYDDERDGPRRRGVRVGRTVAVVTVQDAMVAAMPGEASMTFSSRQSSSAGAHNSKQSETSRR